MRRDAEQFVVESEGVDVEEGDERRRLTLTTDKETNFNPEMNQRCLSGTIINFSFSF